MLAAAAVLFCQSVHFSSNVELVQLQLQLSPFDGTKVHWGKVQKLQIPLFNKRNSL